jgi:hypothetical protein
LDDALAFVSGGSNSSGWNAYHRINPQVSLTQALDKGHRISDGLGQRLLRKCSGLAQVVVVFHQGEELFRSTPDITQGEIPILEVPNRKTIIDDIEKQKWPSISNWCLVFIAGTAVLFFAVIKPTLDQSHICPVMSHCSTILWFLNLEVVQCRLIRLHIQIVIMQKNTRCQPVEIPKILLRINRWTLIASLSSLQFSGAKNMTATIAIENRLGQMLVVLLFSEAVVQPGWSTNASEARTLVFF